MTTTVMPASMTGRVRRVDEPKPRYQVQVRRITPAGEVLSRPPFEFHSKPAAEAQFDKLRALGGRSYTRAGGFRLVLIDTEG